MSDIQTISAECKLAIASNYSQTARQLWHTQLHRHLDWSSIASEASRHQLASLLYATVRQQNVLLPERVQRQIHQHYVRTGTNNALLLHHLPLILAKLAEANIAPIVLKGAALLATLYDDVAYRPMRDIDLLIPHHQLDQAVAALAALDFRPMLVFPASDPSGLMWNELPLEKPSAQPILLELHWSLIASPFYTLMLPQAHLLRRSLTAELDGFPLAILTPTDQLLHLCLHAYYHHGADLAQTMVDLGFLLQKHGQEIDWRWLVKAAQPYRAVRALQTVLVTAAERWFVAVPPDVVAEVKGLRANSAELRDFYAQRNGFTKVIRTFINLPTWHLRRQFFVAQFYPSSEFLVWRYGSENRPKAVAKRLLGATKHLKNDLLKKQTTSK